MGKSPEMESSVWRLGLQGNPALKLDPRSYRKRLPVVRAGRRA